MAGDILESGYGAGMNGLVFTKMDSPVGVLTLVADDAALLAVLWEDDKPGRVKLGEMDERRNDVLEKAVRELGEYFSGKRREFSVPLRFSGTDFQKRVWNALLEIPYGETRSYAWIAERVESPKAVRAVGASNGRNPLSIIAPCHRVVGKDGMLTGFAGGLDVKAKLLEMEGCLESGQQRFL